MIGPEEADRRGLGLARGAMIAISVELIVVLAFAWWVAL